MAQFLLLIGVLLAAFFFSSLEHAFLAAPFWIVAGAILGAIFDEFLED